MLRRYTLLLVLLFALSKTQAQSVKVSAIKLKTFQDSATVIFDLDSVKFYIKTSVAVKYIRKYREHSQYYGRGTDILLKALKGASNSRFFIRATLIYLRDGQADTSAMQTMYAGPMSQVFPYILDAGKVMVYDVKQRVFINSIRITKRKNGNYFGPFTEFKAYYPNGRLFYQTVLLEYGNH